MTPWCSPRQLQCSAVSHQVMDLGWRDQVFAKQVYYAGDNAGIGTIVVNKSLLPHIKWVPRHVINSYPNGVWGGRFKLLSCMLSTVLTQQWDATSDPHGSFEFKWLGWSSWTATKPCGMSARSQVWRSRLHCTLLLSERRISDGTIPWYCTS